MSHSHGCAGEIGRNQAVFGLEPRIAQTAGPDTALHKLLDPGIVIVMRCLRDLERFDRVVQLHVN
jgi:hypothetical protein